jgi:murein DD-endopeptidase MepM/ murein hydrolase activator NlpD
MAYRRKKRGGSMVVVLLLVVVALLGGGYIYTAGEFEREAPTIETPQSLLWNKVKPLTVTLKDNRAIKSFRISLSDGRKRVMIGESVLSEKKRLQTLQIHYPKEAGLNSNATKLTLHVEVQDGSLWNFMQGNSTHKDIEIRLDYKRPSVTILSHSYSMTQGGTGLVVFQAEDENLEHLYVEVGTHQFKVQPYKEEGFYATLVAWPFNEEEFVANIVAEDRAGNRRTIEIPYYLKNYTYKTSWIRAKDSFIDGKITDLASSDPRYAGIENRLERLKSINETMRLENEELIHRLSSKISSERLDSWKINHFYPLRNGQKVASYGDERHYYYNTKDHVISHSYHVGYDFASTKMASIKTSNAGKVVFAGYNGIYGNMPMIDHGLGLYSLYGHCSQVLVNEGDELKAGDVIAKTGVSGLALGDHLHFGMLVQGVEVRPIEWLDRHWIRKNIDNIFKEADKIILGH